ncbi:hypothetical protein P4O66_021708 [Electrophorus voltai]|uniref:Uncharacterized protein n=1 Tax=Electrophorus voltai TaxID=2609070 RepID=A0AAD8ZPP6_9TELE|nr:hypothetical protein P4O66_021708 [Electrophorus voltai]
MLQINPMVRDMMMNRTFGIISGYFPKFSMYNWTQWFWTLLVPLFPSLTPDMLTITTSYVDCAAYHVIVEGLDKAFDQMSLITQQEITLVLVEYLKKSQQISNSALPCGTENGTSAWFANNFRSFSVHVTLADIQSLNSNFSVLDSLNLLSASEVAKLTLTSGALNNTDMMKVVFERLNEGDSFLNVEEYLLSLSQNSEV